MTPLYLQLVDYSLSYPLSLLEPLQLFFTHVQIQLNHLRRDSTISFTVGPPTFSLMYSFLILSCLVYLLIDHNILIPTTFNLLSC